jgi:hypothetical protein
MLFVYAHSFKKENDIYTTVIGKASSGMGNDLPADK